LSTEGHFIASCLLLGDRHSEVNLEPNDFQNAILGDVWNFIRSRQTITGADLDAEFPKLRNKIGNVIAQSYIDNDLKKLAATISDAAYRRRLLDGYRKAAELIGGGGSIDNANEYISRIIDKAGNCEAKPLGDFVVEAFSDIQDAQRGKFINYIPSGYTDFDNAFGGLQKDGLIIIAGRPSMGKSAIAACFANKAHGPVLFESLEMTGKQLAMRYFASEANVDLQDMMKGKLEGNEWRTLADVMPRLMDKKIHISEHPYKSVSQIIAEAKRFKRIHGLSLLIIDYLTLLELPESYSKNESVSQATRMLKCAAKEIGCPIILLSQLNRDLEKRQSKKPIMADLRDSGAVEQDADQIIFPFRPEVYDEEDASLKGLALIEMAKNRNGKTGTIKMTWVAKSATFKERQYGDF